jgi:transposase
LCGPKPRRHHHKDPRAGRRERPSGLLLISPGEAHDASCADALLNGLENGAVVIADKAYDADNIRAHIRHQGAVPNIPNRSNRKTKYRWTKALYRERNRVERFFNRLKQFRRIATRYDKLGANFFAFVKLASMRILAAIN